MADATIGWTWPSSRWGEFISFTATTEHLLDCPQFGDPSQCFTNSAQTLSAKESAYLYQGPEGNRCKWGKFPCTGTCSADHTASRIVNGQYAGQCIAPGKPYKQCLDGVVNGKCVDYRYLCYGTEVPGICS